VFHLRPAEILLIRPSVHSGPWRTTGIDRFGAALFNPYRAFLRVSNHIISYFSSIKQVITLP
jgi:hypothetical protein